MRSVPGFAEHAPFRSHRFGGRARLAGIMAAIQGGQRYSAARQITPANVGKLSVAWTLFHRRPDDAMSADKHASFENTPILAEGRLYVCSPFNEVSALDPGTGKQIWRFDPKLASEPALSQRLQSAAASPSGRYRAATGVCAARIFLNTDDRRLIALDAAKPESHAPDFGHGGTVGDRPPGSRPHRKGEVAHHLARRWSAHGLVIVGSSIDDNQRVDEMRGIVHAFDARDRRAEMELRSARRARRSMRGAANVWAPMSVDENARAGVPADLQPEPGFLRRPDARATTNMPMPSWRCKLATGQVAWSFQIDASRCVGLRRARAADARDGDLQRQDASRPFCRRPSRDCCSRFDRDTGKPLIPVVERKVPQGGAPGERLSPTQPFPIAPKPLAPSRIKPEDAFGLTFWDRGKCRERDRGQRADGLYTPPSVQGTIVYPFTGGGMNWGGLAFDAVARHRLCEHVECDACGDADPAQGFRGAPRERFPARKSRRNAGAPYGMLRDLSGVAARHAVQSAALGTTARHRHAHGQNLWSVPLGTTEDMAPFSEYFLGKTGTPNFGGPIATASGLGLHRGGDGRLSARVRCEDRRGIVARAACRRADRQRR